MKKKILAIVMVAAMAASMAACGSKTSEQPKQDASAATEQGSTSGAKYKIGVCQLVEHAALDAATQGFCDTLKEKLGDDVEIDVKNAQGESTNFCRSYGGRYAGHRRSCGGCMYSGRSADTNRIGSILSGRNGSRAYDRIFAYGTGNPGYSGGNPVPDCTVFH